MKVLLCLQKQMSIEFALTNFYRTYLMSSVGKGENTVREYEIFIDFTLHIHVPVADVNDPTHEDSILVLL